MLIKVNMLVHCFPISVLGIIMNDYNLKYGSRDVVKAAIYMALSENRDEEKILKHQYHENGIKCCAVDFGE